jgi:methyl-accepting chemotaxis protein/molybdopterin converting factor small subunit
MSFKKSLFLALILFSTIPLTIVGLVSAYFIANDLVQTKTATLEILAKTSGDSLRHLIDSQKREFKRVTERNTVVNYLNFVNSGENDEERSKTLSDGAANVLNRWITTRTNFVDIILADYKGDVLSAYESGNIGKSIKDKDYFIKAPKSQDDDAYLSGSITGTLLFPDSKTIAMSHVVYTEDESKCGVIVVFFSVDFFENFIKGISLGNTGIACLADANGEIISHPDKNLIYSGERKKEELTSVFYSILTKYFNDKNTSLKDTVFYEFDGEKRVLGYAVLDELNWLFTISQSQNEMTAPIKIIYYVMGIALLASLIIAATAGFILTNVFTKPINILENAFSRAANEKAYIVCQIESKNEFGHLAQSYNTMISTLNENYEELNAAYETISAHEEELTENYKALEKEQKQNEFLAHYDTITESFNRNAFIREIKTLLDKNE